MKLKKLVIFTAPIIIACSSFQALADTGRTYGPWRYFAPYYFSPSRSCAGVPLTPDDFKSKYELPNPVVPGEPVPAPPERKVKSKVMVKTPRMNPIMPPMGRPDMRVVPNCAPRPGVCAPMVMRKPPYPPAPTPRMAVQNGCAPTAPIVASPPAYPNPPLSRMCTQKGCPPPPQMICNPPACPPQPIPRSCAPQPCQPSAAAPPKYLQNLYKPVSFNQPGQRPGCAPAPPACGPGPSNGFY